MRILMMGTGPFAVPTFESLLDSPREVVGLVTRPVPPVKRRRKTPPNPMRDVAVARQVPIYEPADVNADEAVRELAAFHADLLVVCDYGQILSAAALAVAPLGGVNLHASLLPKYRGAAPINWALYNGETETGVTVIHMTPKLDGGPSLTLDKTEIGPDEDAVQLEQRLSQLGAQTIEQAISQLQSWDRQSPIGVLQDAALATKAPRLKKGDGLVDWTRAAQQIADQVRALTPWPGTFTAWQRPQGEPVRLVLDQVSVADANQPGEPPGQIVRSGKRELVVATGDGLLSIDRLQPAGKRPMDIGEFLRGHDVPVGARFG